MKTDKLSKTHLVVKTKFKDCSQLRETNVKKKKNSTAFNENTIIRRELRLRFKFLN